MFSRIRFFCGISSGVSSLELQALRETDMALKWDFFSYTFEGGLATRNARWSKYFFVILMIILFSEALVVEGRGNRDRGSDWSKGKAEKSNNVTEGSRSRKDKLRKSKEI